ncbi:hypothetical protein LTR85_009536 [Meristemomyces frigidus]|nr:hypothetical protein LTR85_009536 [Meristemomyces frigidus]
MAPKADNSISIATISHTGSEMGLLECIICTSTSENNSSISFVEGSPTCHDCIIERFQKAVDSENNYPVTWGQVTLTLTQFDDIIPAALCKQFRDKEKEYTVPPAERIYCKAATRRDDGGWRLHAPGAAPCGTFLGQRALESAETDWDAPRARCPTCRISSCLGCGEPNHGIQRAHACKRAEIAKSDAAAFEGLRERNPQGNQDAADRFARTNVHPGRRNAVFGMPGQDEDEDADAEAGASDVDRRTRTEQVRRRGGARARAMEAIEQLHRLDPAAVPREGWRAGWEEHYRAHPPLVMPPNIGDVPLHPMLNPARSLQARELFGNIPTPHYLAAGTAQLPNGGGVSHNHMLLPTFPRPLDSPPGQPLTLAERANRMEQLHEQTAAMRRQIRIQEDGFTAARSAAWSNARRPTQMQGEAERSNGNAENFSRVAQNLQSLHRSRPTSAAVSHQPISFEEMQAHSRNLERVSRQPGGFEYPPRSVSRRAQAGRGRNGPADASQPPSAFGNGQPPPPQNPFNGATVNDGTYRPFREQPYTYNQSMATVQNLHQLAGRTPPAIPPRSSSLRAQTQTFQQSSEERFYSEMQAQTRNGIREVDRSASASRRRA